MKKAEFDTILKERLLPRAKECGLTWLKPMRFVVTTHKIVHEIDFFWSHLRYKPSVRVGHVDCPCFKSMNSDELKKQTPKTIKGMVPITGFYAGSRITNVYTETSGNPNVPQEPFDWSIAENAFVALTMDVSKSNIRSEADLSAYVRFLCLNGKQMGYYEMALLDVFLHSEDADARSHDEMKGKIGDDYIRKITAFRR